MAGARSGYAKRMPAARPDARQPTLVAEFGSSGNARAAIEALENHGIDGLEVAMLDGQGEGHRQPADRRAVKHIGGRVAKGIVIGALIGAAILGLVGLVVVAAAGWPAAAVLALIVAGIGFGAAVGAFWSVERGVGLSEDWEKTFQRPDDAATFTRVAVYTKAEDDTRRAREVLEDHRPLAVQSSVETGATP
jgi:hypothetical protein